MNAQEWQKLKESFKSEHCVLILGPGVCSDVAVGNGRPLYEQLAEDLSEKIKQNNEHRELLNATNLGYVAKVFENTAFIGERMTDRKARQSLGNEIQEFYNRIEGRRFNIFQELAKMDFAVIINSSPENYLRDAMRNQHRKVQSYYYNYKKPNHNTNLNYKEPNNRQPLIYNLFGSIENVESIVITESDKIRFVEEIMQREATASLPTDLRVLLTNEDLIFLFMGFDFEQWHLRILLHILGLNEKEYALALQNPSDIHPLTHYLYNKHFLVNFHDAPPLDFLKKLRDKSNYPIEHDTNGKRMFIMYSAEDEPLREQMERHLSMLKNNKRINNIWHEGKILAGSETDRTIATEIGKADIILMLITKDFLASDKIYEQQLYQAIERHQNGDACVIPIIMKPCDFEDTIFADLYTILPVNKQPVSLCENQEKILTSIVEEIKEILNNLE